MSEKRTEIERQEYIERIKKRSIDARSIGELFHAALTEADGDDAGDAIAALHTRTSLEALQRARESCRSDEEHIRQLGSKELARWGMPESLLHDALAHPDDDAVWEPVVAFVWRVMQDVFERAYRLCQSEDARDRGVGAGILGQMGRPDETIHDARVNVLLTMLEQDIDPGVLNEIAVALGHRSDPRAIEPLARLKNHPDENVRYGVVFGLLTHEDERAVQALIELSTDADSDVRDWATFGLGSQIEMDTPAIREALVARLIDEDEETRGEAMVGLAHRHDERVIAPLIAELEANAMEVLNRDAWRYLPLEVAEELGDPRLYPVLARLREAWEGDKDASGYRFLEAAIEKCRPGSASDGAALE